MMIMFTQSTAVLHEYLNDELKIICLLQFFPEVAVVAQNSENSLSFPCSEISLSISDFPGLWPPCPNCLWIIASHNLASSQAMFQLTVRLPLLGGSTSSSYYQVGQFYDHNDDSRQKEAGQTEVT